MNTLMLLSDSAWVHRLGWTLVHSVWQITAIALLHVFVLRVLRGRPSRHRYLLCCATLLCMFLVPLLTYPLIVVDGFPLASQGDQIVSPDADAVTEAVPRANARPLTGIADPDMNLAPTVSNGTLLLRETSWPAVSTRFIPWIVAAWVLGALLFSFRPILGWCEAWRLKRFGRSPVPTDVERIFHQLTRRLGIVRGIEITQSAIVRVPAVAGYLKPVVLLPASAITGLTREQLELVLAHELAHIRRHDYLVNLVQTVIETLLFYHPATWWVSTQLRNERENCCDESVVAVGGDAEAYAETLLLLEEQRLSSLAFAATDGRLLERIRRLLGAGPDRPGQRGSPWLAGVIVIGIALLTAFGVYENVTGQATDDKPGSAVRNAEEGGFQAWDYLRTLWPGRLLVGLPQELHSASSSTRTGVTWTGHDDGAGAVLDIVVEDGLEGEIIVGFFEDPRWSKPPVQMRAFTKSGRYEIDHLTPGNYQVGAMLGSHLKPEALGVHKLWPSPVQVKRGGKTTIQILLSPDFPRRTQYRGGDIARGFSGEPTKSDPDRLVAGRVLRPDGRPTPYAEIALHQYKANGKEPYGYSMIRAGADKHGRFYTETKDWPYRVSVEWDEGLDSVIGRRVRTIFRNRVFEGKQTVNFRFDPLPAGTATLEGQVLDQDGNTVREFHLSVIPKINWPLQHEIDNKDYQTWRYVNPFVNNEGRFKVEGLPGGTYVVKAAPFQYSAYTIAMKGIEVRLEDGKKAETEIQVTAKNALYARIVFADGKPAVVDPSPWPGAKVHLRFAPKKSGARRRRSVRANVDRDGYVAIFLSSRELEALETGDATIGVYYPKSREPDTYTNIGELSLESLSRERVKATVVTVSRPEDLTLGVEVRQVLKPQHMKQGQVLDLATGRLVSCEQSQASLGWSRLAGSHFTDEYCLVVTNGLEISNAQEKRLANGRSVPAVDLWEVTEVEQLAKFHSSQNSKFSIGPFIGPPEGEGVGALPYRIAFKTPANDIGVIEIMSVRGTDIELRYKFIAHGEVSR